MLNISVLIFRVGEISSQKSLSQNVSQLSVKRKLDRIIEGCPYLNFSALVMRKKHKYSNDSSNASFLEPEMDGAHNSVVCWGIGDGKGRGEGGIKE